MDLVVQSADELLAAMPHLLGFKSEESIILVPIGPELPIARVDLPKTARDRDEVWDALSGPYGRHARPGARVGIVCITADRRNAELASQHLSNNLDTVGITTHLRLWADGERWREFNSGATGLQTQATAERIAAKTVLTGAAQPAANRASLAASLVGDRNSIAQALPRARSAAAAAASSPSVERAWALDRLEQFQADGNRLSDVDGARMLTALETISTRDVLWEDMTGQNSASHMALWTDITRRAPDEVRAAPASMLGFASQLAARRRGTGLVRTRPGSGRPALLHGRHRRLGAAERHPSQGVGALPDPDARAFRRARRIVRAQATWPAAGQPAHPTCQRPARPRPVRRRPP